MPTYQYRCRDCGQDLEAVQAFSDDALTECPTCGGSLRKLFSAVGISFKGSGFYKTDSRGGSSKSSTATKSDADSSSSSASSGDSSSSSTSSGDSGSSSSSSSDATPSGSSSTSSTPSSSPAKGS